ncbi:putative periplasmic binding protein [Magnetofaba australis IT-1]|uniref:Putative periplasmic binding protein n=1 Tax=Magnetofaba australis IT-1 TaxID=1434232 RepID=A0A1Y2K1Z3_9PROT|nr:putative periplasmic binding protein [Magnetofaba australis IT-1]
MVSLAPHLTEILFAAGAGEQVVGVVNYSDYPPAAKRLPQVGGYHKPDIERIAALRPDLAVIWAEGNPQSLVRALESLCIPYYVANPKRFVDIARALRQLGALTGHAQQSQQAADAFLAKWRALRAQYRQAKPLRVFYQVWNQPLITVNDDHLIGQIITDCGGKNVFGELDALTPRIGVEAVVARAPEVILASGMDAARPEWLDDWKRWKSLPAVRDGHLIHIPPDLIQRHGPRAVEGMALICAALAQARRAIQR